MLRETSPESAQRINQSSIHPLWKACLDAKESSSSAVTFPVLRALDVFILLSTYAHYLISNRLTSCEIPAIEHEQILKIEYKPSGKTKPSGREVMSGDLLEESPSDETVRRQDELDALRSISEEMSCQLGLDSQSWDILGRALTKETVMRVSPSLLTLTQSLLLTVSTLQGRREGHTLARAQGQTPAGRRFGPAL